MKQFVFFWILLPFYNAFAQEQPPCLIYSCKTTVDGVEQYDIYNSSGEKILPHQVDWAYSNGWTWLFVMDNKTRLITAYDHTGKALGIDSIEATQSAYMSLNLTGIKRNGKWGFYNLSGKLKIPHRYDEISHFENGKAAVKMGDDYFMIDSTGKRLKKPFDVIDKSYSFNDADIALGLGGDFDYPNFKKVIEHKKAGLLDVLKKEVTIPAVYDDLVGIKDNFRLITAKKDEKYGVVNFDGKVIIPIIYETVFVLNDYF